MNASPVVSGGVAAAAGRSVEILEGSDGRLEVRGALTFATARKARQEGLHWLASASARDLEIDCSGVDASDSAGLMVLLDWLAYARQQGRSLQLRRIPAAILALARISEVNGALESAGGVAPGAG